MKNMKELWKQAGEESKKAKERKEQRKKDPSHPRYYQTTWNNLLSFIFAGVNFWSGMGLIDKHPMLAALLLILTGWLLNMFILMPVIRSYSYMCNDYIEQINRLMRALEVLRKRNKVTN